MHLVLASEAEKELRDVVTFDAWGSGLTRAQFLEREAKLRAHRWAREAMQTWLWRAERGEVLASCETFALESNVGGVKGLSYAIASVYTEPNKRKAGHASAMLSALVRHFASGAQAMVLFSEVGTGIYQRLGFWPVPAFDTWFDAADERPDVEWLRAPLPAAHALVAPQTLSIAPTAGQLDWHLERERFYVAALGRPVLDVHGARLGTSCITWTAYQRTAELHVMTLEVADDSHRAPLIRAAQWAAHRAGMSSVRVWETVPLGDVPGARRTKRDDEIAMFCPLTPGVLAWTNVARGSWV